MDTKEIWEKIALDIQNKIAVQFAPELPLNMDEVAEIISHGLKKYSHGQIKYGKDLISDLFTAISGGVAARAEWIDLLKSLCKSLPGYWDELIVPGNFRASTMLLLTDGSVICQRGHDTGSKRWKRLIPDEYGNYLNGTWHKVKSMTTGRLYYASA